MLNQGPQNAPAGAPKRRSDRISVRFPISIIGTDLSGRDFVEAASTEKLARGGATIVSKMSLAPEQEITLVSTNGREILARVMGQISITADGNVYGVAFVDSNVNFWGIQFPPTDAEAVAKVLLECGRCQQRAIVPLNELEVEVFEANDRLQRVCAVCHDATNWRMAQYEAGPERVHRLPKRALKESASQPQPKSVSQPIVQSPPPNRRIHARIKVGLSACIMQAGMEDDCVRVIDMSRGGILISSARLYGSDPWIQVAVPYTAGGANIFVPARIVRHTKAGDRHEYGIKYVRR